MLYDDDDDDEVQGARRSVTLTDVLSILLQSVLSEQIATDHSLHYVRVRCLGLTENVGQQRDNFLRFEV